MTPFHGSRFNGLAQYEDQEDGIHALLLRDLVYTTLDGWRIVVPTGFVTDFASIPRVLQVIIPPRGVYNRPAVVHDFLYNKAPIDPMTDKRCTQARADSIIKEACENCDNRTSQRWAIYLGLRAGGSVAWNNYRVKEQPRGPLNLFQ